MKSHSGISVNGKEKNSSIFRVCRNGGEPTKKTEKEQPEREETNQEDDALDAKQRKCIKEEQVPAGPELTIGFGQQKVTDDLG